MRRNYSVGVSLGGREPANGSGSGGASFSGGLRRLGSRLRPGDGENGGSGGSFSLSGLMSFSRRRAARQRTFGAMRGDVGAPPTGEVPDADNGPTTIGGDGDGGKGFSSTESDDEEEREEQRKTAGGALVAVEHRAKGAQHISRLLCWTRVY